jgi:hypothetical protein
MDRPESGRRQVRLLGGSSALPRSGATIREQWRPRPAAAKRTARGAASGVLQRAVGHAASRAPQPVAVRSKFADISDRSGNGSAAKVPAMQIDRSIASPRRLPVARGRGISELKSRALSGRSRVIERGRNATLFRIIPTRQRAGEASRRLVLRPLLRCAKASEQFQSANLRP